MKRFAQKRLRKFGKGGRKGEKDTQEIDENMDSDEERKKYGQREAPFMKQYKDKKHIEHILDEQHYWSDPEAEKEPFDVSSREMFLSFCHFE